eukprot:gene8215-10454_t
MDGDTAGSISPLAGIDKHYLRQWLRWLETPTAELRPLELNQTDEADLMPYDFLDALEK